MKKTNIILVIIIIILLIALAIMTKLYLDMRKSSKLGLEGTLKLQDEIFDLNVEINKLKKDIDNLKNGKDIEKHIFAASIESFKEENGKTILFVNGDDTNTLNDYKGIIKLILDNNVIILSENNIINKSQLELNQKIQITHSGTIVMKDDILIAPFIYEIKTINQNKY